MHTLTVDCGRLAVSRSEAFASAPSFSCTIVVGTAGLRCSAVTDPLLVPGPQTILSLAVQLL